VDGLKWLVTCYKYFKVENEIRLKEDFLITVKLGYNELGYNELGYNEHPVITNKMKSNGWFQSF
jgi:hypothetical protein